MCDFIKVESIDKINFSNRWRSSETFHCEGRLINKNNEYVKVSYPGTIYQVILKKERAFTKCERITRFAKFIFFSLLTLGLCNLKKSYRGLLTRNKKVFRYAVRFDAKKMHNGKNGGVDIKVEQKPPQKTENIQTKQEFLQRNSFVKDKSEDDVIV